MKKGSVDRIVGISAIIISLCTLIMFIYQTKMIHQQSRLSVTPRLAFTTSLQENDSTSTYSITLMNKGIGPAIIQNAKIIYNDTEHDFDISDFLEKEFPNLDQKGQAWSFSTLEEGDALSAGESSVLLSCSIKNDKLAEVKEHLQFNGNQLPFNLNVEYASMYDELWEINLHKGGHPIEK